MSARARWTVARRCVALLMLLMSTWSLVLLLADWHIVRDHAIDGEKVFRSLYFGPDVRVSDEARAALLHDGLNAGVTERWCTGVEHLGRPTLSAVAATLAFASLALFGAPGWRSGVPGVAALIAAVAALVLTLEAGFLRHLLTDIGPLLPVAATFELLETLTLGAAMLVCLCTGMERRTAWLATRTA